MPPVDKLQAALADDFIEAVKGRFRALRVLLDGEDVPLADEIARIKLGLENDSRAFGVMTALVDQVFGQPAT